MELFYSFRLNLALSKLGIDSKLINPSFMDGTIYFAKLDGLTPAEAASYIFYALPKEYQTFNGLKVISTWLLHNKVRRDILDQLRGMATSNLDITNNTTNHESDPTYNKYENQFKRLINSLLTKVPSILENKTTSSDLIKIVSISKFITIEACARSGRKLSDLSLNERYMIRLFCYFVTIYVARIGAVDFSSASSYSIINLVPNEVSQEMLEHSQRIIVMHKQMVEDVQGAEFIMQVGSGVIGYIQSADIAYLDNLANLYNTMCAW